MVLGSPKYTPPVSSRRMMMSSPSTTSRLRLEEFGERRIADAPGECWRTDRGPCAGATARPPAARRRARCPISARRQRRRCTASAACALRHRFFGDRRPYGRRSSRRRPAPPRSRTWRCRAGSSRQPSRRFTSAMTSGPMPSPGRSRRLMVDISHTFVAMRMCPNCYRAGRSLARFGRGFPATAKPGCANHFNCARGSRARSCG